MHEVGQWKSTYRKVETNSNDIMNDTTTGRMEEKAFSNLAWCTGVTFRKSKARIQLHSERNEIYCYLFD